MLAAKQREVVKGLMKYDWVPDTDNYYLHDEKEGLAIIVRHRENVAMVYPDGTMDRAGDQVHSSCSIKPRAGWYSPIVKKKAERRVATSQHRLVQQLIQLNRHLDAQLGVAALA